MRLPALFTAALLFPLPGLAHEDFNGAWVGWICPSGVERSSGQCANFVLELMEKEGKLCGSHMFAAAGAEQIEEGAAPSLTGDIADGTATGTAISTFGAAPVRMRVELKLDNGALRWQRFDSPSGDYLLPKNARLTKSKSRTLFAPLFEQELRAACTYIFNLAAAQAAPALPGSQGQAAPAAPAAPSAPVTSSPR
jgi:hypothetical protein